MTIQEFQKEATRTMPDLGSKVLNSIHMTLGMGSEILEEFSLATIKQDKVNILEEIVDGQWYAVNYATLHGIEIPEDVLEYANSDTAFISLGRLQDFDKKELCYKKIVDSLDPRRVEALLNIIGSLEEAAQILGLDAGNGRDKVIAKLRERFPDKFTEESAINRNVKKEREILEGKHD